MFWVLICNLVRNYLQSSLFLFLHFCALRTAVDFGGLDGMPTCIDDFNCVLDVKMCYRILPLYVIASVVH